MLVISDLDEPFLPTPEELLPNLHESRKSIEVFLEKLGGPMFMEQHDTGCALGSGLRAGLRLIQATGGKFDAYFKLHSVASLTYV